MLRVTKEFKKPTIAVDFDGTIYSYSSGWKGPRNLPDKPVPGALEFLATMQDNYTVAVYSSRSRYWFGRSAMKRWLATEYYRILSDTRRPIPEWLRNRASQLCDGKQQFNSAAYNELLIMAANNIVDELEFPLYKPPAIINIDDRAITFRGEWPTHDDIRSFRPWNKYE